MKRKNILTITICCIVALAIGGVWYYYNYVATVNDYVLIKITPPQQEESLFGGYMYSKTKFEFEVLPSYDNDSSAVAAQKYDFQKHQEFMMHYWKELMREPTPEDRTEQFILDAKIKAAQELMQQQRILVRTTHIRKFSTEEAFEMIREHWADKSLEKYAKENKIDYAIHNIY